jgi:tRNA pseudouridine55 synthase
MAVRGRRLDGLLLLDKRAGPSSNQALQQVKRLFEAAKAGHAGTLDPFAVGLLPILFGEATKFASHVSEAGKTYEATVVLGRRTTTGDTTGELIEERETAVAAATVEAALRFFRGSVMQIPPMYSALKQDGEPLYRRARRGEVVPRAARTVEISRLELIALRGNELDLVVDCSKGTYIRVLAEDLGEALGCGGTLGRLRRSRVGEFDVHDALDAEALELMPMRAREQRLLPIDAPLLHLPLCRLSEQETRRLRLGQRVEFRQPACVPNPVRLYSDVSGEFMGLGEAEDEWLYPRRLVSSSPGRG